MGIPCWSYGRLAPTHDETPASEGGMTEDPTGLDRGATPLDTTVKRLESGQLLRSAVPLIAAGLGVAGLYTFLAASSDATSCRDNYWPCTVS